MKKLTSINHFNGREQQTLLRLKNKIVELCQPLIIYLIGCNSSQHIIRNCFGLPGKENQWYFSCDLLLVLPQAETLPDKEAEKLKYISQDNEDIRLITHSFDFVKKQLQEYSLFFCWMQHKAIILYERDQSHEKLPVPVPNKKQYAQLAQQFFADNPQYENYTEIKLSPLPTTHPQQNKMQMATRDKSIKSFTSFLKSKYPLMANRNIRNIILEYIRREELGHHLNFKEILDELMLLKEIFDHAEHDQDNQFKQADKQSLLRTN